MELAWLRYFENTQCVVGKALKEGRDRRVYVCN